MRENTQSNMCLGLHNQTEKHWFKMTVFWADMNRQNCAYQGQRKGKFWYLRSNINRAWATALDIYKKGFYAQNETDADTACIWEQRILSQGAVQWLARQWAVPAKEKAGSEQLIANILRAVCFLLSGARSLFADPDFSQSANTAQMWNTKMTQGSLQSRLAVPCRHSQLVLGNQWARCNWNTANCL